MTMKIGQIETNGVPGRRDAFHSPSILVRSEEYLRPKDDVQFTDATFTVVKLSGVADRHGIVDPFIKAIKPGELFWVLLVPDSVGNLVHHFDVNLNVTPVVPAPYDWDSDPNMDDFEKADRARCRAGC
jgi:hypothetical protein